MLTAYDYTMARILDRAGLDVILVGDSASNLFAGRTICCINSSWRSRGYLQL